MNPNCARRTIHTNLFGESAKVIIDSVHRQLSVGKWENTPGYDKYWTSFVSRTEDDGEVVFKVSTKMFGRYGKKHFENPFYCISDSDFKAWIARKIKAVMMDELKDTPSLGAWNRKNIGNQSIYLGIHEKNIASIADVYCVYESLLERTINDNKYDPSTIANVVGTKLSKKSIAEAKALKVVKAKYAKKREELKHMYDKLRAELDKLMEFDLNELLNKEMVEVAKAKRD